MLLKLLLPTHNRIADGAVIVKWHKAPGDFVSYGDDLLDIRVEQGIVTQPWSETNVRALIRAQMTMGDVKDEDLMLGTRDATEMGRVCTANALFRIRSSDRGCLRRVFTQEGDRCDNGACLAILTTDAGESVEDSEGALAQASAFRVLPSLLDADQEED